MHCGALPNRSARRATILRILPGSSLTFMLATNSTMHTIYVEGTAALLRLHTNRFCVLPLLSFDDFLHLRVHARYRHLVVDPAGSLTPRLLRRPAERHDEFGRRGTCTYTSCTLTCARQVSPSCGRSCGESNPSSLGTARREARRVWASRD